MGRKCKSTHKKAQNTRAAPVKQVEDTKALKQVDTKAAPVKQVDTKSLKQVEDTKALKQVDTKAASVKQVDTKTLKQVEDTKAAPVKQVEDTKTLKQVEDTKAAPVKQVEDTKTPPNPQVSGKNHKAVELTEKDLKKIVIKQELGRGGCGKVELVKFRGRDMAMKTLHRAEDLESLLEEAEIHRALAGAGGAPTLQGLCHNPPKMVVSYVGQCYEGYVRGCSEKEVVQSLVGIAEKLHEIHEKGVVHNDFKADNITVTSPSKPKFHIIDFSLSKKIGHTQRLNSARMHWLAPEIRNHEPSTPAGDVYSFGFLIRDVLRYVKTLAVSRALDKIVDRTTSLKPSQRPRVPELISQLKQVGAIPGIRGGKKRK